MVTIILLTTGQVAEVLELLKLKIKEFVHFGSEITTWMRTWNLTYEWFIKIVGAMQNKNHK